MSKVLKFTAALKKEITGGYSVRCVELPAAISQGKTETDALSNIREAIELVLEELEARAQAQISWNWSLSQSKLPVLSWRDILKALKKEEFLKLLG